MRHRLAFFLCLVPALAGLYATALAQKGQPDPGAPSWNDPPPPGVETVKPMAPTWCAGYKPRPWLPASIPYDELQRSGYSEDLLQQIAALACDRPDDAARQQWIAFYRQGWLNIVGTTEREDREAMAARLQLRDAQKVTTAECKPLWGSKADAPAERLFKLFRAQAIGCSGLPAEVGYGTDGGAEMGAASYWIDRAAEPPDELVRLTWVLRCLNPGASSIDPATADRALGRWAVCGHDAVKLDRRAFDRAVDALKLSPLARVRAREMFAYTRKLLTSYQAGWKALVSTDPAYARILETPAQGFAAWVKLRATNKAALDQAFAMEDAFRDADPRTLTTCGETLREALQQHVASRAPTTKDDVVDAVNDDVGQPLLKALVACDSMQGRHALADTEHKLLGLGRSRRGPRTAAFWATLDVVSEIAAEKFRFPVQPGTFGGPLPAIDRDHDWMVKAWEATFNQINWDRDQKGQVAKVVAKGDGVVVSFKTVSWKEPVWRCKETNRVNRILPDGRVEYRESCVAKGTQTVKNTPRTAWIRKDLASGIKPGVFMSMRLDLKPDPAQGFPLEVHADQAQTKLRAYWGFPVAR